MKLSLYIFTNANLRLSHIIIYVPLAAQYKDRTSWSSRTLGSWVRTISKHGNF